MKALVTGGAGLIGSNLTELLLDKGWKVTVMDNLSNSTIKNLENIRGNPNYEFVLATLQNCDYTHCMRDVDVVFHLAAYTMVNLVELPVKTFNNNILGTFKILEAMRKNDIKNIVYISSAHVYGEVNVIPTPETAFLRPISMYGASKLACESLIQGCYVNQLGFKATIIRPSNVISGNRLNYGVFLDFKRKLKENSKEMEILGDGSVFRSYVDVKNAVDAIYKCYEYCKNAKKSLEIFNISNNDATTILTIAEEIANAMKLKNVKFKYKGGIAWKGDIIRSQLSIEKIMRLTSWRPNPDSSDHVVKMVAEKLCTK